MLSTPVSIVSALVARRTASQSGLPGRDPRDVAGGRQVGLSTLLAFAALAAVGSGSRFGRRPPRATRRAHAPRSMAWPASGPGWRVPAANGDSCTPPKRLDRGRVL